MTGGQFHAAFPDEDACRNYLARHRWPSGVVKCPRCSNEKVYHLALGHHWSCKGCARDGYRFSILSGTIFENTKKPLREWFRVIHRMLTSKKDVSAHQIHREMGFSSYRTAWLMCYRVRAGLASESFRKLMGVVEVDETYFGRDDSYRHIGKKKREAGTTGIIEA